MRGQAGFRTVLFLPQVIPLVVVAVIWRMIYSPQDGSVNELLRALGLDSLARPWLGDFTYALPAVGIVGTWVMCGLALVLFMAGVQRIPQSLYDAARVDGAGPVREFFAVTLPNLRGEIAVALTLTTIAALRNFDLVYLTTQGGPGEATSVPAFQVYNRAFQLGQIGSAAAIGFTLACRHLPRHVPDHADRGAQPVIGRGEQALNYAILGVFSLIALYPVAGILLTALAPPGELSGFGIPSSIDLGNFRNAWVEGHFSTYLRSSAIVAVSVVGASTVLSILSGYAFGTMRFRGSTVLFYVFLLGLMVPTEALVVPLYFDLRDLELTDTYWALILPQVALSVAFGTFWMRAFFRAAPRSLLEAARDRRRLELDDALARARPVRPARDPDDDGARLHVDVERVPARARDGVEREPPHRAARARVLPGTAHVRLQPARRRRGDRRDAGRARLRLPPAALHPRDAQRRGEGPGDGGWGGFMDGALMAGHLRPRLARLRQTVPPSPSSRSRSRTASSWCSSARRDPGRRRRCACSPGSSR